MTNISCADCGRKLHSVNRPHDNEDHIILTYLFPDLEDIPPPIERDDQGNIIFETRVMEFEYHGEGDPMDALAQAIENTTIRIEEEGLDDEKEK